MASAKELPEGETFISEGVLAGGLIILSSKRIFMLKEDPPGTFELVALNIKFGEGEP